MHRRLRSILSLLILTLATPCAAGVANQLEPYNVTAERALKDDCRIEGFDDPRIAEFERGVCLFHKKERSEEETGAAIESLRQAQIKGLPPVHQNFAALLSGLMNCQQAQTALKIYLDSNKQDKAEHAKFCRGRRVAAADLGDIHWDRAYFEYRPSTPGFSLPTRLAEMGSCHATVLDPAFDAECQIVSNISDDEVAGIVDEAVNEVIKKYFSGPKSPATAMFARKIARSSGLREKAVAAITGLGESAAGVNSAHEAFNTALETNVAKIDKAYGDYRNAILRANTILDEFERWRGGLFISKDKGDLRVVIQKRLQEGNKELELARGENFVGKTTALAGEVRRAIDGKAEAARTTAQLCRIYYCELANRRSLAKTIEACRRPALANNPLCIDQDENPRSGKLSVEFEGTQSVDVQTLCRNAGLEEASTVIGMGAPASQSCLAAMP